LVSVSAISAQTLDAAHAFCAELDARGVGVSLLVAPRLKGGYRLDTDPDTVDWLAARRDSGAGVVLHGYDEAATKRRRAEFAVLPAHEANLRLIAADRILDHLGLRTRLFAAPRWALSPGALTVLPRNGFRLLVGDEGMTDLVRGGTERARVLGVGEAFLAEAWWCRALVLSAERIARRGGTVRLAVSARQLRRTGPRLAALDVVDLALLHGCRPAVYQWQSTPLLNRVA
jgi:uncharacterized protein